MRNKCSIVLTQTTLLTIFLFITTFVLSFFKAVKDAYYVMFSLSFVAALSLLFVVFNIGKRITCSETWFDELTDLMPGGKIDCYVDDDLTIHYCSPRLMSYLGYSPEKFQEVVQNKVTNLIAEEDRERIVKECSVIYSTKEKYLNFKIKDATGRILPIVAFIKQGVDASVLKKDRKPIINAVLIDPLPLNLAETEHKLAPEKLDSERYKIVAEQSESIIFDYNFSTKKIFLNDNFYKKFGYKVEDTEFESFTRDEKIILEEDLGKIFNHKYKTIPFLEEEVRVKKADGEYIWCKVRMSTIYDSNKKPLRMIGKIIDVNESRQERQRLIAKTQFDSMTELYNKTTTEMLIEEELQQASKDSLNAFLLIDIDNFKDVNDTFGHIRGDETLKDIANNIKALFRGTDIIGRVGGDEFVVFLKDLPNENHAVLKAQDILKAVKVASDNDEKGVSLSTSIGISFFKRDGDSYLVLFNKADIALYSAKNSGKNTFAIYNANMSMKLNV